MLTLRLIRVPEDGSLSEKDLAFSLADLGLTDPPFLPPGATVSYQLTRRMGQVFGRIQAAAAASQSCGSCLADYEQALRADFAVTFEARSADAKDQARAQAEEDDPELAVSFFDGEEMPLGEEIRQELELQLPFAPRCRQDCKGLCGVCGQDLNLADCGHAGPQSGGHFNGLKKIFNGDNQA